MAFTSYPAAGTRVTAAMLQSLISEVRPLYVRKTADETVNNSTTLQNDDHLAVAMAVNVAYAVDGLLRYSCGNVTPDIKIAFTIPTGTTGVIFGAGGGTNVTGQEGNISLYSPSGSAGSIGTVFYGSNSDAAFPIGIKLGGLIRVGSTAGNLRLQWAQVTATATDLKMLTDSYLELTRVD